MHRKAGVGAPRIHKLQSRIRPQERQGVPRSSLGWQKMRAWDPQAPGGVAYLALALTLSVAVPRSWPIGVP